MELTIPRLSDEQIAQFHRDGFVPLPGAFSVADVQQVDRWIQEMEARPEQSGAHWVFHESSLKGDGRDLICRMEKLAPYHQGFAALTRALAPAVGQLLGEPAVLFKEKINFKMPGGDGFKPHQDSQAGWEDYASYFITVMVTVDPATIENGCLQMVRGNHRTGLYREWEPLTDADMADMEFVPYPTQPGDVVLFDSYAPHGSEPNMSDTTRRLYFATYNKASEGDHLERYYADKHKSFPPDIDRDQDKEYVFRV